MAVSGISTLGVELSYAVETTKGTKPATTSSWTTLTRINGIGGISISPETIDSSALEDLVERSVAGRATTGGTFSVTVNVTNDTITEWNKVISDYNGRGADMRMWFQVKSPDLTKAFFIVAQPPQMLPMPDISQNELLTMEIPLTIEEFKGMDTKI